MDSSSTPSSGAPDSSLESVDADQALFDGRVQGLVAVITPEERPLQGLAGLLDWRFQGALSRFLEKGFLTGATGECAYVPLTRAGTTYHVVLVGVDARGPVPVESAKQLKKNLASLKLNRLGLSRADWNGASDDYLSRNLKGAGLCILR